MELYDRIMNPTLLVRRITLCFAHLLKEDAYEQINLFDDLEKKEKEQQLQKAILELKDKYGKNTVLRGISLMEGATARERNEQIGGHKA